MLAFVRESAFSILEAIVALSLFLIFALSVSKNVQMVIWARGKTVRQALAIQIVNDRVEEFAALNPLSLDDNDDSSELVTRNGLSFERETDVTVLPNGSRELFVRVESTNLVYPASAELSTVFSLWGYQ